MKVNPVPVELVGQACNALAASRKTVTISVDDFDFIMGLAQKGMKLRKSTARASHKFMPGGMADAHKAVVEIEVKRFEQLLKLGESKC
ncbi:hypothetical protein [Lysinibacillus piscis]|uniref:Uncharacterized protein n=1 Tax=Lysinibacillus piscis TaxID=2518931 RepID=A0ABQ5NMX0_9BACI|nr:hypothetical protein [Lysinibacillus sp. KH24]GLC89374.1 hypothetical protein LYSBPC_25010 [Lysinibacillus sp. KH24]